MNDNNYKNNNNKKIIIIKNENCKKIKKGKLKNISCIKFQKTRWALYTNKISLLNLLHHSNFINILICAK
jgi:hypothetical protein